MHKELSWDKAPDYSHPKVNEILQKLGDYNSD